MENDKLSLNDYHVAQCLNLIDFLRDRRSSSTKIYLDFLDSYLLKKLAESQKNPSMSEGIHVWITAELDRVYFETYYIHPHNNDEHGVEDGFIEIDEVMLKSVKESLVKMVEYKLKEQYNQNIKKIEQNKINKENDRINFEIFEIIDNISLGKTPSEIDITKLNIKSEQVKKETNAWQLCEDLRNDWSKKAAFLESIGGKDQAFLIRYCIADLFNRVQSQLKESR